MLADGSIYPAHRARCCGPTVKWTPAPARFASRRLFPIPGNILRPGEYGRVRAVTEERHDALLVPQAAVTELQGVNQVAVVGGDNKVKIQNVQIGLAGGRRLDC